MGLGSLAQKQPLRCKASNSGWCPAWMSPTTNNIVWETRVSHQRGVLPAPLLVSNIVFLAAFWESEARLKLSVF